MDDLDSIVEANEQLFSASEVESAAEALGLDDQLAKGRDQFTFDRILPPDLAAAVELITEPYPVDGLSGSVILLNGYSGLNKIKTRIYSDETSSVHPNTYVAGIGVTGLAKTPILDELVRKPVAPLQAEAFEDWRRQCDQWEVSCREQKLKKADRPPKPKPLILQHNNITDPALVLWLEHHATKGVGTHLTFDELSSYLQSLVHDAKRGRGTAEGQMLSLFDGGAHIEIRVGVDGGGELRCFPDSLVSLYGGIQPDKLKELMGSKDVTGKFARFLFVRLPIQPLKLRKQKRTPQEVQDHANARQVLKDYARKIYCLAPKDYWFSQPALEWFVDWFDQHQRRALLPATPQVIQAMLNKASAQVRRVAGMLHIVRVAGGVVQPDDPISLDLVQLAGAMVDQLFAETKQFHHGSQSASTLMMRHIHQISLDAGKAIDRQFARNKTTTKLRHEITAADFKQWVHKLAELGYGTVTTSSRGAPSYEATRPMSV